MHHTMPVTNAQVLAKSACTQSNAPHVVACSPTVTATFDSQGTLWLAWVQQQQIFIQSSSDQGTSFSAPVAVNKTPEAIAAQNESRPKIKVDKQGNIYVSWVLTLDEKRSTYVRFSRSTDGGKHFSPPITINDNLEVIRHRFDSLAVGNNGELFIAWLDARHTEAAKKDQKSFEGLSLYYAWSNDQGQHFFPNQKIADHTCECCRLDTAIDQHNLPVIVWRHIYTNSIRDHAIVSFAAWEQPGAMQHLGQENWQIDACPHHGPGLAIAADNRYHAVWFSNSASKQGLFYAYSTDAGQSFSTPLNFGRNGASHPHVLALGNRVGIVWQEYDGKHSSVQLMQSQDAGKTWSAPAQVAEDTVMLDEPFLITDGQELYLSWHAPQHGYHLTRVAHNLS